MASIDFYENFYKKRGFRRPGKLNRRIQAYALEVIPEGSRILDVGCGDGWFGKQCTDAGHEYIGVDWSEEAIKTASTHVEGDFHVIDVVKDPSIIIEGNYTIITFLQFLEHIKEDIECVRAIPEGKAVFISVPNRMSKGHYRIFRTSEDLSTRYDEFIDFSSIRKFANKRWCDWVGVGVRRE